MQLTNSELRPGRGDIVEQDLFSRTRLRFALYTCLFACACSFAAFADEVASLYSAQGKVEKRASSLAPWNPAQVGYHFEATNACRTGLNSRGAVLFVDGVLIRMNENTLLEFKEAPAGAKRVPIRVNSGAAYFFSREPKRMPQVVTPVVSAAVRGTEFVVEVSSNQTVISVIEGELDCTNAFGVLRVGPGEQAVTVGGTAPVKRILLRPWDAVQWALYYPAVLDAAELARIGFPDAASRLAVDQSVAALPTDPSWANNTRDGSALRWMACSAPLSCSAIITTMKAKSRVIIRPMPL